MEAFPGKTPEFHVLGNHDSWDISREDWARLVGVPKSYYAFDLGGYRHVVLDSNRVGRSGPGVVPPEQLDWLRRTLGASEFPVVVYSHYPVDDQSMEGNCYFQNRPEKAFVSNREEVRAILENSGKVLAVFSGHTHFGSDREIVGIRYVTVPSFSENDGKNRPSGKFAVATLKDRNVIVEVRKAA
jgi:alkaline phosphatase